MRWLLLCCFGILCLAGAASAQSADQNFPTPITANEITGIIKARDLGDSRVTTYFYEFDGGQGDIFINVVTKNLSGDIDIYTADGLRPLTKMVLYADSEFSETGRLVYLRKPARLILRVQGRTPGDDPASFRIKFAGSFVAMLPTKTKMDFEPAKLPTVETVSKVNSVGTIKETTPKQPAKPVENVETIVTERELPQTKENIENAFKKPVVVIQEFPTPAEVTTLPIKTTAPSPVGKRPLKPTKTDVGEKPFEPAISGEGMKPDPLANIKLLVQLKDGNIIEHPMSGILKFSIDKGVLTIITKDGNVSRHSILAIARITIE